MRSSLYAWVMHILTDSSMWFWIKQKWIRRVWVGPLWCVEWLYVSLIDENCETRLCHSVTGYRKKKKQILIVFQSQRVQYCLFFIYVYALIRTFTHDHTLSCDYLFLYFALLKASLDVSLYIWLLRCNNATPLKDGGSETESPSPLCQPHPINPVLLYSF